MRHRIGRLFSVVAILASALIAASPAVAFGAPGASNAALTHGSRGTTATPRESRPGGFAAIPAYPGPSFHICLLHDTNYCLMSNGVTKPVTITSIVGDWSVFTKQFVGASEVFNIENGNGNCLRENSSEEVVIANGPCVSSDTDGKWVWELDANGNFTGVMHNDEYSADDMLVHGLANGNKVWAMPPISGDWTKWSPPA